jgi:tetratricopeptide (TPR) repeat protein
LIFSKEKRYAEAADLFSRALKDNSSLAGAYLYRGIAYYNLGDFRRSVSSLKAFADVHPDDPDVHYYLAGSYSALADFPAAAREFLRQLEITPRRGDLYYYLGHCYVAMMYEVGQTLSRSPDGKYYIPLLLGEGVAQQGEYTIAEGDIEISLKMDPQSTEAYVAFGNLLLRKGQLAAAKTQFREAIKLNPKDCAAFEGLGDADLAADKVADSLAQYTKAERLLPGCLQQPPPENLGLSPQDFRSRLASLKADAERNRRRSSLALEFTRLEYGTTAGIVNVATNATLASDSGRSTTASGDDECTAVGRRVGVRFQAPISLFLANCNELHGDIKGATLTLIAADQRAPRNAYAAYWSIRILMRLSGDALDHLAALSPNSYWIAELRAESLELQGNDKAADSEYKLAVHESGDDPHILVEYGRFKCMEKRFDEAVPILLKALKIVPYDPNAAALLGYIYFAKDQSAAAIPYLRSAINANPGDEQSRIHLGEALMRLQKTREAVTILESAPSDPDGRIHFVLARCYGELGQKREMERALAIFAERQQNVRKSNPMPAASSATNP